MKAETSDQPVVQKGYVESWQQPLIENLCELKAKGRLPHAVLIEVASRADVGAFIWQLSTALLCQSDAADKPCMQCSSCQLMAANSYPDFSIARLEENERTGKLNKDIKIDQIRKLIHRLSLTENNASGKLAVIYPAEKMNIAAANSLLKTLEEPSSNSILLIVSHQPGRLPITIRSRCQRWPLHNPERSVGLDWLNEQGVDKSSADAYLELAKQDAQWALHLHSLDFLAIKQRFDELLSDFTNDRITAPQLIKQLKQDDSRILKLLLTGRLREKVSTQLQNEPLQSQKSAIKAALDLIQHLESTLSVEDNNLNLQLQLEDVLISMKQIINRG
jgi:DNA polymerase-3 subunit delta'